MALHQAQLIKLIAVVGVVTIGAAACSSTIQEGFEAIGGPPTTRVEVGPNVDSPIDGVLVVDDLTLDVIVFHGACDELEGWVTEGPGEVVIGVWVRQLTTISSDPGASFGCEDIGLVDQVRIELANLIGERTLVLEVPRLPESFCQEFETGTSCPPLTLRAGDTERVLDPTPEGRVTDLTLGSGATTALWLGDAAIEIATQSIYSNPAIIALTPLGNLDRSFWGHVAVHNLDRDLGDALPLGRQVDGRDAWHIETDQFAGDGHQTVAIPVGVWSVDVSVWHGTLPVGDEVLSELLDQLVIVTEEGSMPRVSMAHEWYSAGDSELIVAAPEGGFRVAVDPNCESSPQGDCHLGAGTIWPTHAPVSGIAGLTLDPLIWYFELATPIDIELKVLDFGVSGQLVSCAGAPAFDETMNPSGIGLSMAKESVAVFTGLTQWRYREQPGISTGYSGDLSNPKAVATYVRNESGTWDTKSVTVCQ